MQVEVHHVDAEIAGPRHADQRVHVGAVHVEQRALGVQDLGDLVDVLLEDAERVRIGDHQRGDIFGHLRFERGDVDHAACVRLRCSRPRSRRWPRWRDWCRARNRESGSSCADCPASRDSARISRMPVSSPCAPAAGCSVIASMPVISSRQSLERLDDFAARPARAPPADRDAPWRGLRGARPTSLTRGLYFMVQEPSGYMPRSMA